MISPSEDFNGSYSFCSLCCRCRAENASDESCSDENVTPFIKGNIFYNGNCLCKSGHNADCVYKYADNKVIAIETKNQPLNNIDYDNLVAKIENCYNCIISDKLIFIAFILQLSSIKNSSENKFQLLEKCKEGLGMYNIRISKDGKLVIKKDGLKNINVKFDIVKCKDIDDKYFNKLLI
jgi:hypothetical protein